MKTKIFKYLTLALLVVLGVSCSDEFLQEKKNYAQIDDSFYQSPSAVDWYIAKLSYNFFFGYTSPSATVVGLFTTDYSKLTEETGGIQPLIDPAINYTESANGSTYYGTTLNDKVTNVPYTRIRDINSFLENIDVKGASLDKTYRDQAKGQMYYLRAIQYFDLMRMYGGVPIVTTVQNATSTDPSIQLPRASVTEVVAQIVKDLDMAASLLPGKWNAANYGRFTKGAALAQKARVLLTAASPLFNKNWDNANDDHWDAALKAGLAAETQLTADGYGLYGTTAKDWENMFLIDNVFCKEAITVQLLGNSSAVTTLTVSNAWEKGIRPKSQTGSSAIEAPRQMIDLFPMADGSSPTVANGYDSFLFFKNRDPRFYRTFAFTGSKWTYKEGTTATNAIWGYRWKKDAAGAVGGYSDNNQEGSPVYVRKMSNPQASSAGGYVPPTDIFEYRYAELLLNIAECYAAKGDVTNAIAYIGKVRNRVGIPSANNYGLGTLADKYAALRACLTERRIELAYEGKRFWDMQRWMLYNDDTFANNNTCAKLGVAPLNGTQRTGYYLKCKTIATADPLLALRNAATFAALVDPDAAKATFDTQITNLAAFYTANFVEEPLDTPMDNNGSSGAGAGKNILWRSNYYINGLSTTVLSQNSWLKQTIGWKDTSGAEGTFNYQD
ncbi:RagB/SusD family nutrient uptake outer membrane protein [Flavobacterium alvei]|uniref:RagB/SusD family nutrient uptake outer membrane protein n=1 Tax=Flavobacterium alvei TaxID=2080416 RepID=A0A2S5AA64_9FLAO|nr:RagB/SusD family nutrient uptake outer membrane protein [Flavobacterium alvei]POY39480.1 RagB/SusD family nutrient uptake outer membrane protein [Flavobacterium alvei]